MHGYSFSLILRATVIECCIQWQKAETGKSEEWREEYLGLRCKQGWSTEWNLYVNRGSKQAFKHFVILKVQSAVMLIDANATCRFQCKYLTWKNITQLPKAVYLYCCWTRPSPFTPPSVKHWLAESGLSVSGIYSMSSFYEEDRHNSEFLALETI